MATLSAPTSPEASDPRLTTVMVMLGVLQVERASTIRALMAARDTAVKQAHPGRDHRSHWDSVLKAHTERPDLVTRLEWGVDELAIVSVQLTTWAEGENGPESTLAEAVSTFRLLLDREEDALERLERDVKGLRLHRNNYPGLEPAPLEAAIQALRDEHTRACHCLVLLAKVVS